jgi:uncharacterized protein
MTLSKEISQQIKQTVLKSEPGAEIILFGSYARGDNRKDSDIDLLILLQRQKVTDKDKTKIIHQLYDIELASGYPISSVILSKNDWLTRHAFTSFYYNVKEDGIVL